MCTGWLFPIPATVAGTLGGNQLLSRRKQPREPLSGRAEELVAVPRPVGLRFQAAARLLQFACFGTSRLAAHAALLCLDQEEAIPVGAANLNALKPRAPEEFTQLFLRETMKALPIRKLPELAVVVKDSQQLWQVHEPQTPSLYTPMLASQTTKMQANQVLVALVRSGHRDNKLALRAQDAVELREGELTAATRQREENADTTDSVSLSDKM